MTHQTDLKNCWERLETEFLPALGHNYNDEDAAEFIQPLHDAVNTWVGVIDSLNYINKAGFAIWITFTDGIIYMKLSNQKTMRYFSDLSEVHQFLLQFIEIYGVATHDSST